MWNLVTDEIADGFKAVIFKEELTFENCNISTEC